MSYSGIRVEDSEVKCKAGFYRIIIKNFLLLFPLILFTFIYFSYFPGRFSNDSYNAYSISLLKYPLYDVNSPYFILTWKLFGNNNYGPFLLDYIIILSSIMLIYRGLKTYLLPQSIVLFFLLVPPFLISFTYAWKDNVLLSFLLLLIALFIQNNKRLIYLIIPIFGFAISLRFNAFFATLPLLWFYCDQIINTSLIKKIYVFLIIMISIFFFNYCIIYKILGTHNSHYIQQIYTTDILKISYRTKTKIDLPKCFLEDTSPTNIDKVFDAYNKYHSNDYFFYKLSENFNPILNSASLKNEEIRTQWIKKVTSHPKEYLLNRYDQWLDAITHINYISLEPFNLKKIPGFNVYAKLFYEEQKYDWMNSIRNFYQPTNLEANFKWLLKAATPIIYLISSLLLLIITFITRNLYYKKLIIAILFSGVLYTLGYLPMLPAGDYRYFNWTILSFILALGLYLESKQQSSPQKFKGP